MHDVTTLNAKPDVVIPASHNQPLLRFLIAIVESAANGVIFGNKSKNQSGWLLKARRWPVRLEDDGETR